MTAILEQALQLDEDERVVVALMHQMLDEISPLHPRAGSTRSVSHTALGEASFAAFSR